jgi:tryptophan 7-halogenase
MTDNHVRRILIVGGGVAAWIAALVLSKILRDRGSVRVLETPGTADAALWECGHTCLPPLKALHRSLTIDEREFMRQTRAVFRLGTEFRGWGNRPSSFFQPLGEIGAPLDGIAFHHHWLRVSQGSADIAQFSLNAAAARLGRFVHPSRDPRSILSTLDYAYHFDTSLYVRWLRAAVAKQDIPITPGAVREVQLREPDGFIEAVVLATGERIEADLFVDCSGSGGALIEQALKTGYEDWSHWLPCDRAVAVFSAPGQGLAPFTQVTRRSAGWQWRVPLQGQTSCGYVYSGRYVSDDEALSDLRSQAAGTAQGEPQLFRFTSGHRRKFWNGNCIALGLAAGFMEPMHATNLHLIHSGVSRLATLFPHRDRMTWASAEYNRLTQAEYERIRDLLVLHYRPATQDASAFWQWCSRLDIPDPLQHKLRVFGSRGRIVLYDEETFTESHWVSMLLGQQVRPEHPDALAQTLPIDHVAAQLQRMKTAIDQAAQAMPAHESIIRQHCAAEPPSPDTHCD